MVDRFAHVPSPLTLVFFQQLGNAANRISAQETAFSHRDALYEWGCLSSWLDPADDGTNIRWTRELAEAMRRVSGREHVEDGSYASAAVLGARQCPSPDKQRGAPLWYSCSAES